MVKRSEARGQVQFINAAFKVSLFLDQIHAVVAERIIIHAVHLRGIEGRIFLAKLIQFCQSISPIAGCDQLLGGGKHRLLVAHIGGRREGRRLRSRLECS